MLQRRAANVLHRTLLRRSSSSRTSQTPAQYCAELVKKLDYENYLCTLLLKENARRAGFAIRAFNAELASIRDQVSKATIGQGRLVFWRDTINRIYGGTSPQHPVAKELLWVLTSGSSTAMNKQWFSRLIDSRELNAKDSAFDSISAAEAYAENSCSPVYYLILESQGFKSIECDHTASHLGKAHGLTNLIRGVPYNASKGRCYLPMDLMAKHGVSQEKILKTSESNLHEVIFEIAAVANLHVEKANHEVKKLPKQVHDIFLPLVCLTEYLERIRKADFHVFDPKVQVRDPALAWKLLKAKVKQKLNLWP